MFKMLTKCVIFVTALVTLVIAKEEPFSIGLGVLSPSYSQTVGKDGEGVKVNFEQKDGGAFSFSIGDEGRGVSHYHHLGGDAGKALQKAPEPAVSHAFPGAPAHQQQPIPYASGNTHHGHAPVAHHQAPVAHHQAPAYHHSPPVAHHSAPVHHSAPAHHHSVPAHHHSAPVAHHAGPAHQSFAQGLPKDHGGYIPTAHHNTGHAAVAPAGHAFSFTTALGGGHSAGAAGSAHRAPVAHAAPAAHHGAPAAPQAYNGVPQVTYYNSIGGHGFQTQHQFDGPVRGAHGGFGPVSHASAPVAAQAGHAHAGAVPYNNQGFQAPAFHGAPFQAQAPHGGQNFGFQGQGGYGHGGREHGGHSQEDLSQNRYQG